jgi:DNA-binding transcriptional LysR family regulator
MTYRPSLQKRRIGDNIHAQGEYMDRLGAMAQFVRVVEAGSFSAAARVLGQGQPGVSKAIAQLEARLGVRLVNRTTRALALTDAGRAFYDRAKAVLDAAEEAEAAAKGADAALSGRLRVCAPVTFARLHIIPALPAFVAAHPGLDLDLVLDDRRIDLIEEGIDVAIRAGTLTDSSMVATHIAEGRRQVIGARAFWDAQRAVREPGDLATLPFIAYGDAPGGLDWIFAQDGKTELVRMSQRLRVSALEGVREAVFAGLGFAIVSEWAASDAIAAHRAHARLETYRLPSVDLWAIYPSGRQPATRARLFVEHVRAKLKPRVD